MSQVQQVKDATDIVQVIGQRLKLDRAGTNYKALCPFHGERTPSFFVNDQLQRFRCFGCGESGDVFEFLEKYEGMSFSEALRELADQAGIELKEYQRTSQDDQRARLLEVLNLAKEYYHYLLTKHDVGKKARAYLKERSITQESIKVFQLGYALPGWDGLVKYLHGKKKYSYEDLQEAGLVIRGRGGRYYDRFRGRIMFPLKDHRGRVVGFSGRLLEKEAKEAKYINTPETSLYHKAKMLYGYKELFQEIKKAGEVIVVEGEVDVITSAQAHVNNIVAIKGSALTTAQVKLLGRAVKRILLSLDADSAGEKATQRAIEVAKDSGLELRVVDLSQIDQEGVKDVDDLARENPKKWREVAQESISVYEFLFQLSLRKHDQKTPEGKRKIVMELAPIFGHIPHAVEQDFYVQKLAQELNTQKSLVQQDIQRYKDNGFAKKSSPRKPAPKKPEKAKEEISQVSRLETYLAYLAFHAKQDREKKMAQLQSIASTGALKNIAEFVIKKLKKNPQGNLKEVTAGLAEDLKEFLFGVLYEPRYTQLAKDLDLEEEWKTTSQRLKTVHRHEKIAQLNAEIEKLDAKIERSRQEDQRLQELLKEVVRLQKEK